MHVFMKFFGLPSKILTLLMSVSSGAGCSAAWAKPEMLTMMAIKEIMKGFDLISVRQRPAA